MCTLEIQINRYFLSNHARDGTASPSGITLNSKMRQWIRRFGVARYRNAVLFDDIRHSMIFDIRCCPMRERDTVDNLRLSLPFIAPDIEYRGASQSKIENLAEVSIRHYKRHICRN